MCILDAKNTDVQKDQNKRRNQDSKNLIKPNYYYFAVYDGHGT